MLPQKKKYIFALSRNAWKTRLIMALKILLTKVTHVKRAFHFGGHLFGINWPMIWNFEELSLFINNYKKLILQEYEMGRFWECNRIKDIPFQLLLNLVSVWFRWVRLTAKSETVSYFLSEIKRDFFFTIVNILLLTGMVLAYF